MRDRIEFVDGFRGWAALIVVVYHAFCNVFPINPAWHDYFWAIAPLNGPLAVNVFFVLSGFSLSIPFIVKQQREVLVRIAAGRYFRLVIPVFIAVMASYLVMSSGVVPPVGKRGGMLDSIVTFEPEFWDAVWFALYDAYFAFDLSTSYITPLWTMPIEFVGSMVLLGAVFLFGGLRSRWVVYVLLVCLLMVFDGYSAGIFFVKKYYALFIAGAMVAEAYVKIDVNRISRFSVPAFAIGVSLPLWKSGQVTDWYFASALFLVLGVFCSPSVQRFLKNKPSLFLGKISFSLYLIHLPVFFLLGPFLLDHFGESVFAKILTNLLLVVASVLFGILFWPSTEAGTIVSRMVGHRAALAWHTLLALALRVKLRRVSINA